MAAQTWHLVLESAAALVLGLWGGILIARAPKPWAGADRSLVSPRSSVWALKAIAGATIVSAGIIHASAAGAHESAPVLGTAVAALAALQVAAGTSLLLISSRSASLVAIAAVTGLTGWGWSATLGSQGEGHSAIEMAALATIALEIIALGAAVALSLPRRRRVAQFGHHATLLWAIAIPVIGIGAILVLLAVTNGAHPAHGREVLLLASLT